MSRFSPASVCLADVGIGTCGWPWCLCERYEPHSEEDGFGNGWECARGLPTGKCGMQIVRPGKVQCDICDSRNTREQP